MLKVSATSDVNGQATVESFVRITMAVHSDANLLSFKTVGFVIFIFAKQSQQGSSVDCGSKFGSRIVGESEAIVKEFPWMVHLQIRDVNGQLFSCGGTLISSSHVLTATYCLVYETKIHDILSITLGAHDISATEKFRQIADWNKIEIPFDDDVMHQDIAIITLSSPVNFTDHVRPVCLPFADESDHENESVVLAGWGEYSVLRKIETTVLSLRHCHKIVGKVPNDVICSDGVHKGNDGGSMNYFNTQWNRWSILGVARRGGSNVFIRIRNRLDFIRQFSGIVPPKNSKWTEQTPEELTTIPQGTTKFSYSKTEVITTTGMILPTTGGSENRTEVITTKETITPTTNGSETRTEVITTTETITTKETIPPTTEGSESKTEMITTTGMILSTTDGSENRTEVITTKETITPTTNGSETRTEVITTTISLDKTTKSTEETAPTATLPPTSSPTTSKKPEPFTCAGKTNGHYPNPASACSTMFYICSNGYLYLSPCPSGLVFREEIGVCDYLSNVVSCN